MQTSGFMTDVVYKTRAVWISVYVWYIYTRTTDQCFCELEILFSDESQSPFRGEEVWITRVSVCRFVLEQNIRIFLPHMHYFWCTSTGVFTIFPHNCDSLSLALILTVSQTLWIMDVDGWNIFQRWWTASRFAGFHFSRRFSWIMMYMLVVIKMRL